VKYELMPFRRLCRPGWGRSRQARVGVAVLAVDDLQGGFKVAVDGLLVSCGHCIVAD
jgi:hypothetical protein